jgi:hypothetical protein
MDPQLTRSWMREGRLPNLAALAARGSFAPLQTIESPDCETAWATIAAGRNVGKAEIASAPAQLLLNFLPLARERWTSTRSEASFWTNAGEAGFKATVLSVPGTFPPAPLPNGELLAGPPLPDLRKTAGTYQFFSSTLPASDEGRTPNGGLLRRLEFERRVARTQIVGPWHPVSREELFVPMTITWNHEARSANVEVGPHVVHLREREWSRWLELDFPINSLSQVRGMAQLLLLRAGTELHLYVSPLQWHPASPPAPISSPPKFAGRLFDRLGMFRTNGWNAATAALVDERIDEAAFLEDLDRAFQDRAETLLSQLDTAEWNLTVGVVETPDRVQHVMWRLMDRSHPRYDSEMARRYGASIEQSYQQADELLGDIVSRLASSPDALIMVISDHGFASTHADSKWSGEHVGRDGAARPGLIVANKKLIVDDPQLMDIAPSVLKHLRVAIPGGYTGRPLF